LFISIGFFNFSKFLWKFFLFEFSKFSHLAGDFVPFLNLQLPNHHMFPSGQIKIVVIKFDKILLSNAENCCSAQAHFVQECLNGRSPNVETVGCQKFFSILQLADPSNRKFRVLLQAFCH
jgi:hypothetical protein